MTKKSKIDAAQLFWGGNGLWLGPWKAAEIEPVWYGDRRDIPPHGWRWRVGCHESDSDRTHESAMSHVEFVVMGQLRSIGVPAATFRRLDGSTRSLEMP
jgi:hypothetical protein